MYRTSKTLVAATTPSSLSKFTFAWQELRVHASKRLTSESSSTRVSSLNPYICPAFPKKCGNLQQQLSKEHVPHATAASAFVTGLYGIVKGQPMYPWLAIAAAANTGITAGTFFGLREYIVAPLLVQTAPGVQYARRRRKLGLEPETEELPPLSRSELRTEKLLDSGLSGLTTGSLLQVLRNNIKAAPRTALTGMVVCTVLQYGYNEFSTMGSKQVPATPSESSSAFGRTFLAVFGIHRMNDEEHILKLKRMRDKHLLRISELEKQIKDDKSRSNDT